MTDPTTIPTRVATPAPRAAPLARRRLRLLAFAVTATGLINVLSALTPLMRDRLEVVGEAFNRKSRTSPGVRPPCSASR
jgi:hypothetical protein